MMDVFGAHTPFVVAAYAATFLALGAMIVWRVSRYSRTRDEGAPYKDEGS